MHLDSIDDMFVEEDVLVVSSVGGSSSGGRGTFHLAPAKIDERVESILEKENLNRDDMEKSWKEDIRELQDESFVRIESVSARWWSELGLGLGLGLLGLGFKCESALVPFHSRQCTI